MTETTVIVGGGLAGLAAATYLARAGRRVTLFERAAHVGGRATSVGKDGYVLNQGPHAVYAKRAGAAVLADLGVRWTGGKAGADRGLFAARRGRLFALPTGAWTLATTRLLDAPAKLEVARVLAGLGRIDTAAIAGESIGAYIDARVRSTTGRELLRAVVRVATYGGEPAQMSAGLAIEQVRTAAEHGVHYLDGGWQTVVDGLARAAAAAGVVVRTDVKVAAIEHDAHVRGVRLDDGSTVPADTVVLALSPGLASKLLHAGAHDAVTAVAARAEPVRLATLDLGLSRLPVPGVGLALGVDAPTYVSVHTRYARLAPDGGAVVHASKYLGTAAPDPERDRADVEAALDLAQPGWRDVVVARQYLPAITVHHALVTADRGGLRGRPAPDVAGVRGLFVAGDWVGAEGLLCDAALASAREAARLALADRSHGALSSQRAA